MDAYAFSTEQQLDDVLRMLTWWKTRTGEDPEVGLPQPRSDPKQPLLVVLLDDLERGQAVDAVVLEPRSTLNETQVISALGAPAGGYLRLGFKPSATAATEWTPNIYPLLDDAGVIERYLGALPSLSLADVSVTLGLMATGTLPAVVSHNTWRWQVTFLGRYAGLEMEKLEIDSHLTGATCIVESRTDWESTGRVVQVREVIGVPFPTPARRGARAWVEWKSRAGWCVTAIEPRDFGDYGLFT